MLKGNINETTFYYVAYQHNSRGTTIIMTVKTV